jgi:signal transduction histidine kinase
MYLDRYCQADAARSDGEKRGTGAKLTLARQLAGVQGGRISLRSTLGHGAEFGVHLPPSIGSREDRGAA